VQLRVAQINPVRGIAVTIRSARLAPSRHSKNGADGSAFPAVLGYTPGAGVLAPCAGEIQSFRVRPTLLRTTREQVEVYKRRELARGAVDLAESQLKLIFRSFYSLTTYSVLTRTRLMRSLQS
jgi:hypothetical protein